MLMLSVSLLLHTLKSLFLLMLLLPLILHTLILFCCLRFSHNFLAKICIDILDLALRFAAKQESLQKTRETVLSSYLQAKGFLNFLVLFKRFPRSSECTCIQWLFDIFNRKMITAKLKILWKLATKQHKKHT